MYIFYAITHTVTVNQAFMAHFKEGSDDRLLGRYRDVKGAAVGSTASRLLRCTHMNRCTQQAALCGGSGLHGGGGGALCVV